MLELDALTVDAFVILFSPAKWQWILVERTTPRAAKPTTTLEQLLRQFSRNTAD
jgi:hypothetical protein